MKGSAVALVAIVLSALPATSGCGLLSQPSCEVGKAGTDLTAAAVGDNALGFCQGLINNFGGSGYAIDPPNDTSGTLICRVTIRDGTQVTVRDKGILKVNGNGLCLQLQQDQ